MGFGDILWEVKWAGRNVKDKLVEITEPVTDKARDMICDGLDAANEKVSNFCDNRIKDIEQMEETVEILCSKDLDYDGEKKGYELAAAQYETAFANIKKEYAAVIKLTREEKEAYTKKITEQIEKLQKLEEKQEKIEQKKYKQAQEIYSGMVSYQELRNGYARSNTILKDFATKGIFFTLVIDKKRNQYYAAQTRGFEKARKIFEEKLDQLKVEYAEAVQERKENMEGKEAILQKVLKSIEEKEIIIAEMTVLINMKES